MEADEGSVVRQQREGYGVSGRLRYLNPVPEGYGGTRCSFVQYDQPCGLPTWEEAAGDMPRCEFHSDGKPEDIKERLERAIARGADLSGAKLANLSLVRADLSGAILPRADLSGSRLRFALLGVRQDGPVGRPVDLRFADLRGARLGSAHVAPETRLEGARFGRCVGGAEGYGTADEVAAARTGKAKAWSVSARAYRHVRLAYQHSGNYGIAGEWYLAEMRCLRRRMVGARPSVWARPLQWVRKTRAWRSVSALGAPLWRWLSARMTRAWWWVMEYVAGYGERPSYVAGWMAGVVFLCALVQGWLGIEWMKWDAVLQKQVPDGIGGFELPSWDGFMRFLNAAYFSLITFTTTGYGDMHPANGWGRGVASLEALSGVLLTSLLLVCVVRKFSR